MLYHKSDVQHCCAPWIETGNLLYDQSQAILPDELLGDRCVLAITVVNSVTRHSGGQRVTRWVPSPQLLRSKYLTNRYLDQQIVRFCVT
jgi:hypothetical protein